MSLTSHLANENSPILNYFVDNFKIGEFIEEENKGLSGAYTIKPKSFNNYPWSDMGHMVEYLLNLHMGLPVEHLFPMRFAKEKYSQIFYEMKRKYEGFSSRLNNINFNMLSDDLYRLSKIEGVYRNGGQLTLNYLQNVNATEVMKEDLKTIYQLSLSENEVFNNNNVQFTYNPVFDLSANVGGADADIYIIRKKGNYLLDLKTTIKPQVKEDMLYQLLGYIFLDQSGKHNFIDIGLYLPRQNLISEWNIEEIIQKHSTFSTTEEAKKAFINVVNNLTTTNKIMKK